MSNSVSIILGITTIALTIVAFVNALREYKRKEEAHMERVRDIAARWRNGE